MANTITANRKDPPYPPSLFDRFTDWVDTLPVPALGFYTGLLAALILGQVLLLWWDDGLQVGALLPVIIFNGVATPFVLALLHLLDNQAVTALDSMRPALDMTGPEFDEVRYKLSTMPALPPLISALVLLVLYILLELLWVVPDSFGSLDQLPSFAIAFHIIDKSSAFLFGAFFYHSVRQLRMVNAINSNHTRISLFNLGPLQAFSKLTASTAVGLVIGVVGWMLLNPDLLANPTSLAVAVSYTALAVTVFVWPLWGVHKLMNAEKERMLQHIDLRFEAAFSELDERLTDDDYPAIERLNGTIASLEIQYKRIATIATWPWRPETARFVLTAIALPLILTFLQFFAEQAFDW